MVLFDKVLDKLLGKHGLARQDFFVFDPDRKLRDACVGSEKDGGKSADYHQDDEEFYERKCFLHLVFDITDKTFQLYLSCRASFAEEDGTCDLVYSATEELSAREVLDSCEADISCVVGLFGSDFVVVVPLEAVVWVDMLVETGLGHLSREVWFQFNSFDSIRIVCRKSYQKCIGLGTTLEEIGMTHIL